jgi:hypothetical protein
VSNEDLAESTETPVDAEIASTSEPTPARPTAVAEPARRRRLIALVPLLVIVGVIGGVWLYNAVTLQKPLDRVLVNDPRNQSVKVRVHYDGWIDFNTVVFDISDVSPNASRMDVFRCFLQYAEAMKGQRFKRVILAARGKRKFWLDGEYFQQLGQEYQEQNPVYTIRTFPTHLTAMDGSHPFSEYTGGIFAVLQREMEQFTEFHDQWYVNDFASGSK